MQKRSGDPEKLQEVFDALNDTNCRTIISNLENPMAAEEISEKCDLPLSTTYRKLDLLKNAFLIEEKMEVKKDGHHLKKYKIDFEEIRVVLDEDRSLKMEIKRKSSPDQRLEDLWIEIRKEI